MSAEHGDRFGDEMGASPDPQWFPLIVAWLIVGIPTLWGVTQTVVKALALFR